MGRRGPRPQRPLPKLLRLVEVAERLRWDELLEPGDDGETRFRRRQAMATAKDRLRRMGLGVVRVCGQWLVREAELADWLHERYTVWPDEIEHGEDDEDADRAAV